MKESSKISIIKEEDGKRKIECYIVEVVNSKLDEFLERLNKGTTLRVIISARYLNGKTSGKSLNVDRIMLLEEYLTKNSGIIVDYSARNKTKYDFDSYLTEEEKKKIVLEYLDCFNYSKLELDNLYVEELEEQLEKLKGFPTSAEIIRFGKKLITNSETTTKFIELYKPEIIEEKHVKIKK